MAKIKIIFLFYILYLSTITEAFFINAKDIRKFFGLTPTFYEIYRKEATQNYRPSNYEERRQDHNQQKKYENNINEKLPPEDYYYKRSQIENNYEHDSDYSNKHESRRSYLKNYDRNCDESNSHLSDRSKNFKDDYNPKVHPHVSGAVYKFQRHADKINKDGSKQQYVVNVDDNKKDQVSGILVALPNLNAKDILDEQIYVRNNNNNNNEKYYIKALLSSTPQPEFDEDNGEPGNIFSL